MASSTTFVLLVAPDPATPHLFRAWCPDLPNWYATGDTQQEAADAGSEVVRALIAERRATGQDVEPVLRAVPVPVDTASRQAPASRPEVREEDAEQRNEDETRVPGVQWMRMPIEAGSRQRSRSRNDAEGDDGGKPYAVREARLSDEASLAVQDSFEF